MGPTSGPRVLIFTPRDWAFHVQVESVIGHALQLRGARVTVLGCGGGLEICDHNNCYRAPPMPCGSCVKYTREAADAHGFHRIELSYPAAIPWPELDDLSIDELYEVQWDGFPLGALVKVPTQWFNMSTRIHDDPLALVNVRRFLSTGRRILIALQDQLDDFEFDVALALNGTFYFESILAELCRRRSIDLVTYEKGFVPGSLVFRRNEAACYYDQGRWWDDWSDRTLDDGQQARLTRFLADRQTHDIYWRKPAFENLEQVSTGRLAVMFTNVTWDSAVIGRDVAFRSIHTWIASTIELFAERPADELIIRVHPAEAKLRGKATREPVADLIAERFPTLPSNVRIVGPHDVTSSYSLMEQADIGLVYTSTTGLELALAGTPVLVAGGPHYRGKGFTKDANNPSDYRLQLTAMLDDPLHHAPDVDRARRYASLFFFESPVTFPQVVEPWDGVPSVNVSDLEHLSPGHDPELDRLCEDLLHGGDFGPRRRP